MSAQSSQRECSYSEEVQEFGSSFAHLCGSLRGLCVKKWRLGLDVFLPQRSPCRRKVHRGNVVIARVCRSLEAPLRTFAAFELKKWRLGLDVFLPQRTQCWHKVHKGQYPGISPPWKDRSSEHQNPVGVKLL
jgi:hypothetical protein